MTFRHATPDDIPALVALKLRADATHAEWTEGFTIPTVEAETAEWRRRLELDSALEVAVVGDEIVGVVSFKQAREDRVDGPPIEGRAHVSAVFVDPAHFRRGIARALLERADAAMRSHGFDEAQLWTLDGSPAERLYENHGWVRDGRRDHHPGMDLPIVAYVKPL